MSAFKKLQNEMDDRFGQQPDFQKSLEQIHRKVDQQQGLFSLFSSVVELFLPQPINTALHLVGSEGRDALKTGRSDSPEDGLDDRWPMPDGYQSSGRG